MKNTGFLVLAFVLISLPVYARATERATAGSNVNLVLVDDRVG